MTAIYLALLAVLLAGFGARDQVIVAVQARAGAKRPVLLAFAVLSCIVTAAVAAWLATYILAMLGPDARLFMAAFALGFAGFESLVIVPRGDKPGKTGSALGAALVIASAQATDAARFLIFAVAVATGAPAGSAVGGAIGGIALVILAWVFPQSVGNTRVRRLRRMIGAVLLIAALVTGLVAAKIL